MNNLSQYRKFASLALAALVVILLLTFAALWNSLLTSAVKHEGWVIGFLLLLFVPGVALFYIAYTLSDHRVLENIRTTAYEAGKEEILKEIGKRNQTEKNEQQVEEEDLEKTAESITGIQGTRSAAGLCNKVLSNLANQLGFVQGIAYVKAADESVFQVTGEYALTGQKPAPFRPGEGIPGQVAASGSMMILYDIPEDYFNVASGLGSAKPRFLLVVPVISGEACIAVLELAAFKKPDAITGRLLQKVAAALGTRLSKYVVAT